MRTFIIFYLHQMLLGRSNQSDCNVRNTRHSWKWSKMHTKCWSGSTHEEFRRRREDNIRIYLTGIRWEVVKCIFLSSGGLFWAQYWTSGFNRRWQLLTVWAIVSFSRRTRWNFKERSFLDWLTMPFKLQETCMVEWNRKMFMMNGK